MANSFEPLAGFAGIAATSSPIEAPPVARPWFVTLGEQRGFLPDHRFSPAPVLDAEPPAEPQTDQPDAVLADMLADAERRGREEALAQMASEGAAPASLKLGFQRLDETLHEQLAQRLAETVAALCEATLSPLTLDAGALQRRCLAAAALLGDGIAEASLHLHPDDIALLDPHFAARWAIVPAPGQERGTIHFATADGAVRDGPEEWRAALKEALGLC